MLCPSWCLCLTIVLDSFASWHVWRYWIEMFRRRNNLLRTTLSEETGTDSPGSYINGKLESSSCNSCGSGSCTGTSCYASEATGRDEFLEYYRQYRRPEALPEGYLLRRMDSSASLPIESYYRWAKKIVTACEYRFGIRLSFWGLSGTENPILFNRFLTTTIHLIYSCIWNLQFSHV